MKTLENYISIKLSKLKIIVFSSKTFFLALDSSAESWDPVPLAEGDLRAAYPTGCTGAHY